MDFKREKKKMIIFIFISCALGPLSRRRVFFFLLLSFTLPFRIERTPDALHMRSVKIPFMECVAWPRAFAVRHQSSSARRKQEKEENYPERNTHKLNFNLIFSSLGAFAVCVLS